jgi:hypothetical protein
MSGKTNAENPTRGNRTRVIAYLLLLPFPVWLLLSLIYMLPQLINPCPWPCSEGYGWTVVLILVPVGGILGLVALIGAVIWWKGR